jgi:hypothetical protein
MNRRYKHKKVGTLSHTFAGLIRDQEWEYRFDQHRVFPAWKTLVDAETAACSRPLKVVKDVLWLEVDNSAWMQQLQFKKIQLLECLNGFLRVSYFSDIRFVVKERSDAPEKEAKPARDRVRFEPPSEERLDAFRAQIDFIEDEAIKESMLRLWYISQACKQPKR